MRHILVIGAGKSTSVLISYLLDKSKEEDLFITIGDIDLQLAHKIAGNHPRCNASLLNIFEKENREKAIQEADIVTTFAIDDELRNTFIKLVKEISGKDRVELKEKIDPEIIGGYVLTVDDRQVDESLESKLKMIQIRFTQNLYEKRY